MELRSYRATLTSPTVGRVQWTGLANWYAEAEERALAWVNGHADHGKHGPWTASNVEVGS